MAELITTEMGSPVAWATMAQVFAPTMIFDYYVGLASTFAFDEVRQGLMGEVLVAKEPVGVVGRHQPLERARCSSPPPSSVPPSWPAARWCSSPLPRRPSTPSGWPRCSKRRACPPAC